MHREGEEVTMGRASPARSRVFLASVAVAFFLVGVGVGERLGPSLAIHLSTERTIRGSPFELFAVNGPFAVYTDKEGDEQVFAVFKGHECLYKQEYVEDGALETMHFENGRCISVSTLHHAKEQAVKAYTFLGKDGELRRTYVDQDGDGVWDHLLDFREERKLLWEGDRWRQADQGRE